MIKVNPMCDSAFNFLMITKKILCGYLLLFFEISSVDATNTKICESLFNLWTVYAKKHVALKKDYHIAKKTTTSCKQLIISNFITDTTTQKRLYGNKISSVCTIIFGR
jgi:hypothetical protein